MASIISNGYQSTSLSGGADLNKLNQYVNDPSIVRKNKDIDMMPYDLYTNNLNCSTLTTSSNVGIQGNLTVNGSTTFNGSTTIINANDVEITDRTLLVGKGNNANVNCGLVFENSSTNPTRFTGIEYHASSNKLKCMTTTQALAGASIDESNAGWGLANLDAKLIYSSDKIGIGTTAPVTKLQVDSGAMRVSNTNITAQLDLFSTVMTGSGLGSLVNFDGHSNTARGLRFSSTVNTNNKWFFGLPYNGGGVTDQRMVVGYVNSAVEVGWEQTGAPVRNYTPLTVWDALNTRMGVNIITPTETFHVGGNARVDNILRVGDLINAPQKSTAPTVGVVNGSIYYDTTLNKLRVYENGAWKSITTV